jgi:type II secretory pathway component PulF
MSAVHGMPLGEQSAALTFAYRVMRQDGVVECGELVAPNREAAVAVLAERGLWTYEIRARPAKGVARRVGTRMPVAQLALGLRVLADFLESGLPLARALSALEELAPPAWRDALPAVRESVRQGKSLAGAIGAAPVDFPAFVIGVVHAGEAGSGLASAVRRAAESMEEAATTRAAVRGALAYPIILATAGTASVALLVGAVLPRFAAILADLGQSLPPTTRLVLSVAALARDSFAPSAVAVALGAIGWRAWTATDAGLRQWHAFLLETPVLGALRRTAATGRGCSALAGLLASGVPIAPALAHAARAMGDAALSARLLAAREAVVHGERLSRALAMTEAATPTAVRLARAGEESGRLAPMLAHAARLEREHALERTRGIVRLLEPGLILVFGAIVSVVAAALLQALYSVRPGA